MDKENCACLQMTRACYWRFLIDLFVSVAKLFLFLFLFLGGVLKVGDLCLN